MIGYFKMKRNEWKVKSRLYGLIASFIDNQEDILNFIGKLYESLKDVDADEMKEMFVSKVAELVHESSDYEGAGDN